MERDGDAMGLILFTPIAVGIVLYLAVTTQDLELASAMGLLMFTGMLTVVLVRDQLTKGVGCGKAIATLFSLPLVGVVIGLIATATWHGWLPASIVASLLVMAAPVLVVFVARGNT